MEKLNNIDTWVFDMDNTLYDYDQRVLERMAAAMIKFIEKTLKVSEEEANRLRVFYLKTYGTTLNGLMKEYNIKPADFIQGYLDIDISHVTKADLIIDTLKKIDGRKFIFTNSSREFTARMTKQLGIENCFDAIFCVEDMEFIAKPSHEAYLKFINYTGINPKTSCMFEDTLENLEVPHRLGMKTVWIYGESPHKDIELPYVDYRTERLSHCLHKLAL